MRYAKFALAVVVTVISGIVAAMTDGHIANVEWVNVAIAGTGAAAVFAGPNVPGAQFTKAVLAVLAAVLTFLTSAITDGISTAEWLQIAVIAAGAVGVFAVPNSPTIIDGETVPSR